LGGAYCKAFAFLSHEVKLRKVPAWCWLGGLEVPGPFRCCWKRVRPQSIKDFWYAKRGQRRENE